MPMDFIYNKFGILLLQTCQFLVEDYVNVDSDCNIVTLMLENGVAK